MSDHDHAHAPETVEPPVPPAEFWERRYAGAADRVWSGRVNTTVAAVVEPLPTGRALDLGCGEGADVLWLAENGWTATGIDISPTAVDRARAAAAAAGLADDRARFVNGDLATWQADGHYDLVCATFLHAPPHVELPRTEMLRRASDLVAPGGHLLVVGHAARPPWVAAQGRGPRHLPTPEEDLAALALDPETWRPLITEIRPREATSPDGETVTLDDCVLLLARR